MGSTVRTTVLTIVLLCFGGSVRGVAQEPTKFVRQIDRIKDIRTEFGVSPSYENLPNLRDAKVAILDSGFAGVEDELADPLRRRYMPAKTELIKDYGVKGLPALDADDDHGLQVAQIISGIAFYGGNYRLYNANGPSNFLNAVRDLIKWGAKVVYCAKNWQTYGNFDGKGFINKAVEEFTDEGGIWIQAAGNDHKRVYNGAVKTHTEQIDGKASEWVTLPSNNSYLRLKNRVDDNRVTISLSWNDFHPGDELKGTKKNLDLFLYKKTKDGQLELVEASRNVQVEKNAAPDSKDSILAYESITTKLRASDDYLIAVKKQSGDFDATKDRIRVTVSGNKQPFSDEKLKKIVPALEFPDYTDDGEIGVPADNRYVITVGDFTENSSRGPTADGRGKPEILFPRNSVAFTSRDLLYGTSYAGAYLAGIVVLLKAKEPLLTRDHLLRFRTNDPKKLLAAAGWDTDQPYKALWGNEYARAKFASVYPIDRMAARLQGDGYYTVGLLDPLKDLHGFKTLPDSVRNNFDDYELYVFPKITPTVKTVKDPDQQKQGPDKKVMTAQAEWVPRVKLVQTVPARSVNMGYYTLNYPGYNVYEYSNELVPAKFKTVPGEYYTVPGQYRQVEGEPVVELTFWYRAKSDTSKPLWEQDEKKWPRGAFLRVEQAKAPTTESKGVVIDGSDKQPKLWSTPNVATLQKVVGG